MYNYFNLEDYLPTQAYNADFFISTNDNLNLDDFFSNLKFSKKSIQACNLYIKGLAPTPEDNDYLFSGISRFDRKISLGPFVSKKKLFSETGNYYSIFVGDNRIEIESDFFGLTPIFYSDWFVSNRLQLIFLALLHLGKLELNKLFYYQSFAICNSFCYFPTAFNTIINDVKKCPYDRKIIISNKKILFEKKFDNANFTEERLTLDEYKRMIEKSSYEIVENIDSILNSYDTPLFTLTAGRDSRIVYAALIAMGKVDKVKILTYDINKDLKFSKALVSKFGGKYQSAQRIPSATYLISNMEYNFNNFYRHYFFENLDVDDTYLRNVKITSYPLTSYLGGECGEVYRDFYQFIDFGCTDKYTREKFIENLSKFYWENDKSYKYKVAESIADTFEQLDGEYFSDKSIEHFINFHNTFHFGCHPADDLSIRSFPILSKNLYLTSRMLPPKVRASGRISFDITRYFCEELAYCEFDSGFKDFSKIPFHTPSKFDGQPIKLDNIACDNSEKFIPDNLSKTLHRVAEDTYKFKKKILTELVNHLSKTKYDKNINRERLDFVLMKKDHALNSYLSQLFMLYFIDRYEN